jgi:hypothetical protein
MRRLLAENKMPRRTRRMKGGAAVNALYLGMATDIASALYLVSDFTTLFAINKLDDAYGSWPQQKKYIKQTLTDGDDSAWLEPIPEDERVVTKIGVSEILTEEEDDVAWTLTFMYKNKERKLVYYYDMDFLETWPVAVNNIRHILCMGAFSWSQFIELGDDAKTIIKMFEERTTSPWIYALSFNHPGFPYLSNKSFQEKDRKVAAIHFNKLSGNWWKKDYTL